MTLTARSGVVLERAVEQHAGGDHDAGSARDSDLSKGWRGVEEARLRVVVLQHLHGGQLLTVPLIQQALGGAPFAIVGELSPVGATHVVDQGRGSDVARRQQQDGTGHNRRAPKQTKSHRGPLWAGGKTPQLFHHHLDVSGNADTHGQSKSHRQLNSPQSTTTALHEIHEEPAAEHGPDPRGVLVTHVSVWELVAEHHSRS
mmetsp:Transcript_14013/g.33995  ORF Transcript_14013/g.33995 Transcript_14013/m.33995 type:complete len:201 (-) Transcript_14013:1678-2280(-)